MYLAGGTTPSHPQGGLYKTADGGKTWKKIIGDAELAKFTPPGYTNAGCVKLHPDDPNIVYYGTEGHGLWVSKDAGSTWQVFESLPFRGIVNLAFDPADRKTIYVCTYGCSVLKGHYLPIK
jgi:hypothetical protein